MKNSEIVKISFLGDIMCESPLLAAAANRAKGSSYDFSEVFRGMIDICSESDYVVGNLETPFAGRDAGYTREMYSFNTPDSFAVAVKQMGLSLVLTANNHCCDRGIQGLKRTLDVLDDCGLAHVGTFATGSDNMPAVAEIKGIRIAVVSCTASTNAGRTKIAPDLSNVNLIDRQYVKSKNIGVVSRAKTYAVRHVIGEETHIKLRALRGLPPKAASVDDALDEERVESCLRSVCDQITWAKRHADVVFVCPHMGGQFNVRPGKFSEYVMRRLVDFGADAVVASHPHVAQKAEIIEGVPCAYSIGNVSMSMSTPYVLRDNLPDYGVMMHFYIAGKKICRMTYSLIKMEEDDIGYVRVRPLSDVYHEASEIEKRVVKDEATRVALRFCGTCPENAVARELELSLPSAASNLRGAVE